MGSLSPGQPRGSVPGSRSTGQERPLAQVHTSLRQTLWEVANSRKYVCVCVVGGVLRGFHLLAQWDWGRPIHRAHDSSIFGQSGCWAGAWPGPRGSGVSSGRGPWGLPSPDMPIRAWCLAREAGLRRRDQLPAIRKV